MIHILSERFKKDLIFDFIQEIQINDDWSFCLPDEFVKRNEKVWEDLGMLEGLKEPARSITAYNYGMMVVYLLLNEKVTNGCYAGINLSTVIFPIIRRSSRSERLKNPKLFWEFCGTWLREHADWIDNMRKPGVRIDAEAEACAVLAENIEMLIKRKDNETES